ncbi:DNA internalization-related competence protein ComEC/Rec2 [Larsenimonas rhizosphaerae]|uniref:DNA internalization-related competence protein ComEC/Rec2 n=1 Tax=Larsenimonas rhizosphaerae TaxID=2944682 RepID=UPI002033C09E|nr:DNA internalization-related competence protein ComEC/Rec2 [Larsenimonas rhizosphaerae]MCM2130978.1 DNA internalization-related competence protein ComEC/Rec2 [Larsenimonas rhizosphaerae]
MRSRSEAVAARRYPDLLIVPGMVLSMLAVSLREELLWWVVGLLVVGIVSGWLLTRRCWLMWLAGLVLFAGWHHEHQTPVLADTLAGRDMRLMLEVDRVDAGSDRLRLEGTVAGCEPVATDMVECGPLNRLRLDWYDAPAVLVGERWQLTARLKPPHGYHNPGRFDYQAWLLREGISATGYVRSRAVARRIHDAPPSLRQALHAILAARDISSDTQRWLSALTLGNSQALSRDEWETLAALGITHLFVVSGLHVGLVIALIWWVTRQVVRCVMPSRWRVSPIPWVMAALGAVGYAALVGWTPPVTRAAIMALMALWVRSGRRAPSPWQGWWLAMLLVLWLDPLATQRQGFWLSFAAVGLLLMAWVNRPIPGWWWGQWRSQLILTFGMGALVVLVLGQWSVLSLPVNLVAIPLVTLIMVPLALAGWIAGPWFGVMCWQIFGWVAQVFWDASHWLASVWPVIVVPEALREALSVLLFIAALTLCMPGVGRMFKVAIMAVLLAGSVIHLATPSDISPGLSMQVHDVGQGLAVSLMAPDYHALYDTGPRFRSGFAPLSTLWDRAPVLDDVIISHGDLDHAGGLHWLESSGGVIERLWRPASVPVSATPSRRCVAGEGWQKGDARLTFLWPERTWRAPTEDRNDSSCVLLVETPAYRALVLGDAGRRVERWLVRRYGARLADIDVLIASHHGSRTGSDPEAIRFFRPDHVIFSAGYLNRYDHPHPEVVQDFRATGSCLWSTALDGAITLTPVADGVTVRAAARRGGIEPGCLGVESAP